MGLKKVVVIVLSIIPLACALSCSGRAGTKTEGVVREVTVTDEEISSRLISMVSPEENAGFKIHESVKIVLEATDKAKLPDSVRIFFDGKYTTTLKASQWEFNLPASATVATGRKSLKVIAFGAGKQQNTITRFLIFYSDVIPEKYGYKVVHSYPHDSEAFTQGLVFDGGRLFESTGQKGSSSLREVDIATGRVIRQQNLDAAFFGEGIAIYRDRIYQVTWEDKIGFVYDKSSFNIVNKIYYPTEGWGLTTVDDKIAMSDGTNIITFYEPEMFTAIRKIEVYDNQKKVDQLNELEFINGEIWANVWMTDLIVRIDPVSGKVLSYIDLKGILPDSQHNSDTDVLNGIAFDREGGRIFVTGKKWPLLYEISPVK